MPVGSYPSDQVDDYWHALGQFIDGFAWIESEMQLLIWQETKVPADMAKAIFSGFRLDQAKDLINRAREASGKTEDKRLKRAFAQLTVITKARNDIVHYGATFVGEVFSVSNAIAAHVPNRIRETDVSPKVLLAMIADLYTIGNALSAYQQELLRPDLSPDWEPAVVKHFDEGIKRLHQFADAPWQYKPPQPPPQPTPRPSRPPKPKPLPASSQA